MTRRGVFRGCLGLVLGLLLLGALSGCAARTGALPRNADLQRAPASGNFVRAGGKLLFLNGASGRRTPDLLSFDPGTGEISLLFGGEGDGSGAEPPTGNLEAFRGEVYALGAAGSVLKWGNGGFETVAACGADHFFHSGDDLYVATARGTLEVYPGGAGEPKTLLSAYSGYGEAVVGDCLYFRGDGYNRLDLRAEHPAPERILEDEECVTDGLHIYYVHGADGFLYRAEMDGSGGELWLTARVLPESWNFDGDALYFRLLTGANLTGKDSEALYRIDKSTPGEAEKIAELPVSAYRIYTDPDASVLTVTVLERNGDASWREDPEVFYAVQKDGSGVEAVHVWEGGGTGVKTGLWRGALPVALAVGACLAGTALVLWRRLRKQRRDAGALRQAGDAKESYYRELEAQVDSQRVLLHDMKNHLEMIRALARDGSDDAAARYVSGLLDAPAVRKRVRYCANPVVNLLLSRCAEICGEKDIQFSADVRNVGMEFLSPEDATAILGNLLENAVEAAEGAADRVIELRVDDPFGNGVAISVVNGCREAPSADGAGGFLTRKKDREKHGVGLRSVRAAAEKYHGTVEQRYDLDEKRFHTLVVLH